MSYNLLSHSAAAAGYNLNMSLIKCPHCGKMVSSYANKCFYCGNNIHSSSINKSIKDIKPHDSENSNETNTHYSENKSSHVSKTRQKCINNSWVNFWKRKVLINKIILLGIFLVCLIVSIISFNSLSNCDVDNDETLFIALFVIFSLLSLVFFALLLGSLLGCLTRTKTINYDCHTILVYVGIFKKYLVIDNNVFDCGFSSDSLHGTLPNKKEVVVSFTPFSGAITINIY